MRTLSVRAAHSAMCPDFEALEDGVMRYIGRRFDSEIGHDRPRGKGDSPARKGGWVPTDQPVTVPFRAEYLQELRAGALLPADEETARLAGVPFSD